VRPSNHERHQLCFYVLVPTFDNVRTVRSVVLRARLPRRPGPAGAGRPVQGLQFFLGLTVTPPGQGRAVAFGHEPLSIRDVLALADGTTLPVLAQDTEWRARMDFTVQVVVARVKSGPPVYGVTTGFGSSGETEVQPDIAAILPNNLMRYHGCGTGPILSEREAAAILAVRLASLARGWSGVRLLVLERLCDLLARRLLPRIPAEGSVGASGDLTPLSYVAATLAGEGEVTFEGVVLTAKDAFARSGLAPIVFAPKETLALMNGTSAMTGLACVAYGRAVRLARFACGLTAMAVDVMRGQPAHFDERIFEAKPHPGQRACAAWIRADLECGERPPTIDGRLQDRYSIRCAPHVIGVLVDGLTFARSTIEIEVNGVNDNPLIDPETGDVLHGGNFYGGHIAFVMDAMKCALASVADLLDRQLVLLASPATNNGLPANLVGVAGRERAAHHGCKGLEIAASALTAEALKGTMPAASFSRSTEGHNQDKVSMGMMAARDCLRVLDLSETVAAIELIALCQAVDLRQGAGCHMRARALHAAVRTVVPMNTGDRRQDKDIERVLTLLRGGALPIGEQAW
jgi:histidine ammonia-lyase